MGILAEAIELARVPGRVPAIWFPLIASRANSMTVGKRLPKLSLVRLLISLEHRLGRLPAPQFAEHLQRLVHKVGRALRLSECQPRPRFGSNPARVSAFCHKSRTSQRLTHVDECRGRRCGGVYRGCADPRVELVFRRLHAWTLKDSPQGSQPGGNASSCQNVSGCFRTCQSHRPPPPPAPRNAPVEHSSGVR